MSSRRSHQKSRTGCKTCKRRKIKCDELVPCTNCVKHSIDCDLIPSAPTTSRPSTFSRSPAVDSSSSSLAVQLPTPQTIPSPLLGSTDDNVSQSYNMLDLELLHHYSTSTYATVSNSPLQRNIFKVAFPKVGFQHPFVLRTILAFTALHVAYFRPEKRAFYTQQAMIYHSTASSEAARLLSNLNEENSTPLWAFSCFTFFFVLASPREEGDLLLTRDGGIAEWLLFFRGMMTLIRESQNSLHTGELRPLFEAGKTRTEAWMKATQENPRLHDLETLFSELLSRITDADELNAYDTAIRQLRQSFNVVDNSPGAEGGLGGVGSDVFRWSFMIPERYLDALIRKEPFALVVFAWFCVLLKSLEGHWWMTGWAQHLIERIWLLLNDEHRFWIRWPIEEIGWVPPS